MLYFKLAFAAPLNLYLILNLLDKLTRRPIIQKVHCHNKSYSNSSYVFNFKAISLHTKL